MGKKEEKTIEFIQELLQTLINYALWVYMGFIIVVLPLYYEQGYGYIATDKATFFCKMSVNIGKVLLPLLILYIITSIAANYAKIALFFRNKPLKAVIKEIICKISAIDFFVGMYGVAVVLSYLCSDYKENALWGMGGWYMGFYPQLMLVCSYFLIAKFWNPSKWLFCLMIPVSAVVFFLGYLNRFGYYPIEMEYASVIYISTIGNINWYCSYVVPVLFTMIGLFWQGRGMSGTGDGRGIVKNGAGTKWERVLQALRYGVLGVYICLGFATLTTQGSASGMVALGVMMLVLFSLSAKDVRRMLRFWCVALLLSGACMITMRLRNQFPEAFTLREKLVDLLTTGWAPLMMTLVSLLVLAVVFWSYKKKNYNAKLVSKTVILCVTLVSCIVVVYVILLTLNTIHPGAIGKLADYPFFTFSDTWGSHRGTTWKAGALCFAEQNLLHKLVGVGPDAMWSYINAGNSQVLLELTQETFGTGVVLTNAHNEWLTVLVNYGLLGLVGFAGTIVSAVRMLMRKRADVSIACALGILAYTANNMFSFQQVMNVTILFLLLGMGSAFLRQK